MDDGSFMAAASRENGVQITTLPNVRKEFPETWIWEELLFNGLVGVIKKDIAYILLCVFFIQLLFYLYIFNWV